MNTAELMRTHDDYPLHAVRWQFLKAAYDGPDALIAHGILRQYATEDDESFNIRKDEAVGYGHSKRVVNLYVEMLKTKPVERDWGVLADDKLWKMFLDDCNQHNTALQVFLLEQSKRASVYGHVGILVDKPAVEGSITQAQAIENGVYPYLAAFTPAAILDWSYTMDQWDRPVMAQVKLLERNGRTVLIYDRAGWQRWQIRDDENKDLMKPVLVGEGLHEMRVVPFVWLTNRRDLDNYPEQLPLGESDLAIIGKLDASIMRNVSGMDEVAKHAAFPMFREPTSGLDAETGRPEREIGPQAVVQFEPREGEVAKPDWLESAALEPVNAHLAIIEHKQRALYDVANMTGIQAVGTAEAKSGLALKIEFQQLNSVLSGKAESMEEAERTICWLWCKWQGRERDYDGVTVVWPREFDVEDMAADLENLLALQQAVSGSATFQKHAKMTAARKLPAAKDDLPTIEKELEASEAQAVKQREQMADMDAGLNALNRTGGAGGKDDGE